MKALRCFFTFFVLVAVPASAYQRAATPEELYDASVKAEIAGDRLQAYSLALRAAALDPNNRRFALQANSLQGRLMQATATSAYTPQDENDRRAFRIAVEGLSPSDVIESQAALPPTRLKGSRDRKSFDLRGTARPILEEVGRAYGIHIIFEPDYQSPPAITFRVNELTMEEAFHALETITNSFLVPIRETEAEVFRDTTQNRNAFAPVVSMAIPIPDRMNIQDAQDLATGVQTIMEIRRMVVDPGRRVLYMRDQESKVLAARRLLYDLARHRAQVEIEVQLLSVTSNTSRSYGMNLPTSFPLVNFSSIMRNAPTGVLDVAGLIMFGGGNTLFGLGITSASAFATVSQLTSQTALITQVSGLDGQQLTVHVGDRYPVVTGRFGDPNGGGNVQGGNIPQIQYQDLGLKLTMTPSVHNGEITLSVEGEHNLLGPVQSNGIPIIGSRKFQGNARLRTGEWAVFSGLTTLSSVKTVSGMPVLSQIPWVGQAFRNNTDSEDSGELLVVLKPRLISQSAWEEPTGTMYVGTESKPLTLY